MFSIDPSNPNFIDSLNLLLKIVGGVGGLILFIAGFQRYVKGQTWKKNEFVANEIKDFLNNRNVKNVMQMLDWTARRIELFPDESDESNRKARVNRQLLISALQSDKNKDRFSKEEVAIRDNFDVFFDYLERFHQFIEAGLITEKELKPYLEYWINKIYDLEEPDAKKIIHNYIVEYKFTGVQKLFVKFKKHIIAEIAKESNVQSQENRS